MLILRHVPHISESFLGSVFGYVLGSFPKTLVLTATHLGDAEIAPLCETLMDNDMLLSLNVRCVRVTNVRFPDVWF